MRRGAVLVKAPWGTVTALARAYSSVRIERLTTDQKVGGSNPPGRTSQISWDPAVGALRTQGRKAGVESRRAAPLGHRAHMAIVLAQQFRHIALEHESINQTAERAER
jgi:hypothetical protein